MFCIVWDYTNSKLKDNQYKQKFHWKVTRLKSQFLLFLGQLIRASNNPALFIGCFFVFYVRSFLRGVQWIGGYFRKCAFGILNNRPIPSSLVPPFQNKSKCETFHMKISSACSFIFLQIKVIFIRMVSHLDSLWNRGTREHGNSLFDYDLEISIAR